MQDLGNPRWYEMFVEVNDREPIIDQEYETMQDLLEAAVELIKGFREEQDDLGSWAVFVTPHWCDGVEECNCLRVVSDMKLASFRGMTIDDLRKG